MEIRRLKIEMKLDTDAMAVGTGVVTVGQAPDVVDTQDGEDVVKPHPGFHIGLVAHWLAGDVFGEEKDIVAQCGVVLVAQTAPDATQT